MPEMLLEPRALRVLESLRWNPRQAHAGRIRGERLTRRSGLSIDFRDYRDYVEGDDLRHLDWNVFARLDHPIVKTYQDEEDLAVHILVDCSPSMDFGTPNKHALARQLAFAAGMVGMLGGDAVTGHVLGRRLPPPPAMRGRSGVLPWDRWCQGIAPNGHEILAQSLARFVSGTHRVGLVILITDGLDPGFAELLRKVSARGHELFVLHLLAPEEVEPDIEGDLRLVDSESESTVEITASQSAINEYKANLKAHCELAAYTVQHYGGRYARVLSDQSVETVVRDIWQREAWVR